MNIYQGRADEIARNARMRHLGLAADPDNCVLSDGCARWIIDDMVSTCLEKEAYDEDIQ